MRDETTPAETAERTETSEETETDGGVTTGEPLPLGIPAWVGALVPLVLLAVIVGAFVLFPPFAGVTTGEPLPDVAVTHTTLHDDEIVLHVTNSSPMSVTVEQVLVDEAYWEFTMYQGGEQTNTLGTGESGRIEIPYHWQPGWDLETAIVLDSGATFHHTIEAPQRTRGMSYEVLETLAIVGIFVGVIPVALGMLWFPFMQRLDRKWLHVLLLFAAGILAFLAFDAGFEALEIAERVPGFFEGQLLVVLGIVGTLLLVQAISAWQAGDGDLSPLGLAYMIALGIGLHNLAEGLAIGSSFALGRVSLGAFLVIGFMIHNVTEGPAIVAPVAGGERPALRHFVGIGLLAGAPIILGGWIGGFAFSPTVGALFLAVGVGAILQVDWEIASMIRREGRLGTAGNLLGFLGGFVVMYATDLLVVV
jgi:zinc transporter ZupT